MAAKRDMSVRRIEGFLGSLDWSGHVEIGDNDRAWLAIQIMDYIYPSGDKLRCESCGELHPICIKTAVGLICEECIDAWHETAGDTRDEMENV